MFPRSAGDPQESSPSVSFDEGTMKENAENADHRAYRKTPHPEKKRPAMFQSKHQESKTGSDVYAARANDDDDASPRLMLAPDNSSYSEDDRDDSRASAPRPQAFPRRLHHESQPLMPSGVPGLLQVPADGGRATASTKAPSSTGNEDDANEADEEEDMEDVDMEAAAASESEAAAAKWAAFCDELRAAEPPTSAARQNLEEYEHGKDLRNKSREAFSSSYQRCIQESMEGELWNSLDSVKASLEEWSSDSARCGDDVGRLMKENHRRRTDLHKQVLDAFETLGATCRGLAASVMSETDALCGAPPPPTAKACDSDGSDEEGLDDSMVAVAEDPDPKANASKDPQERQETGGGSEGDDPEKVLTDQDWDALLAFEPMRDNTQALIDAHAFMVGVDDRLSTAVANISGTMQECLDGLQSATEEVYGMFSETLTPHEDAIQAEMARNLERRIDYEAAVREQALESQNYFQHLMTNIRVAYDPAAGSTTTTKAAVPAQRADSGRGN